MAYSYCSGVFPALSTLGFGALTQEQNHPPLATAMSLTITVQPNINRSSIAARVAGALSAGSPNVGSE